MDTQEREGTLAWQVRVCTCVIQAVRFLKAHNFLYETIDINEEVLQATTESDGGGPVVNIPSALSHLPPMETMDKHSLETVP